MAVRTLIDVIADINAIFIGVSGIVKVYPEAPDVPPSASGDLPCVIPLVERMVPLTAAFGFLAKVYTIRYLLLVTPAGGKSLISAEKQARPFMDSVPDAFFAYVKLADPDVDHGELVSMDYKNIVYSDQTLSYIGYEVYFSATIKKVINQGT